MNQADAQAEQLADLVQSRGWTAAVAESLTSGAIASQLGKAPNASSWFLGAVVAYTPTAKFDVLFVPPGPVVSPTAACAMADAVATRFGADLALAATGVGTCCGRPSHHAYVVRLGAVMSKRARGCLPPVGRAGLIDHDFTMLELLSAMPAINGVVPR